MTSETRDRRPDRSLTRSLVLMVAGSFAFGFALVPLYDVICEAAGIRVNAAPSAIQASDAGAGRHVTLEFMSMVPDGSGFDLVPETRSMSLQPGKLYEAKFRIRSHATVPVVAHVDAARSTEPGPETEAVNVVPSGTATQSVSAGFATAVCWTVAVKVCGTPTRFVADGDNNTRNACHVFDAATGTA